MATVRNFEIMSIKRKVVEFFVVEIMHKNRLHYPLIITLLGALLRVPTIQS
jgi:hypothetical protein